MGAGAPAAYMLGGPAWRTGRVASRRCLRVPGYWWCACLDCIMLSSRMDDCVIVCIARVRPTLCSWELESDIAAYDDAIRRFQAGRCVA